MPTDRPLVSRVRKSACTVWKGVAFAAGVDFWLLHLNASGDEVEHCGNGALFRALRARARVHWTSAASRSRPSTG